MFTPAARGSNHFKPDSVRLTIALLTVESGVLSSILGPLADNYMALTQFRGGNDGCVSD